MNIVVLTGAGISQESGIATFRGAEGLWEGHRIEDVATPEAFSKDPDLVYEFYNMRRKALQEETIKPNNAHIALAEFEKRFTENDSNEFLLVTQNVDNLHERAGSKNLIHMHGELLKARCLATGKIEPWTKHLDENSMFESTPQSKGKLRPHIVWFGEMPLQMDTIYERLETCDLFVAIGTSGHVYPAAGFVQATPSHTRKVEINLDGTPVTSHFDESILGKASEKVEEFFNSFR